MVYKSCAIIKSEDVKNKLGWGCGKVRLVLKDFTHNGENLVNPHPRFIKYYSKNPFWVQLLDDDDLNVSKEFEDLIMATEFYNYAFNNIREAFKQMR